MMFNFYSFPANKGDSFLLTWGNPSSPHHILIDAGIPGTYRFLRPALEKLSFLDAIILTHIDYDHIGGLLKLISDDNLQLKISEVYMNSPELALAPSDNNKVGIEHGIKLDALLLKKGITSKSLCVTTNEINKFIIDGLEIQILSPTEEILSKFLEKWKGHSLYEEYVKEHSSSDKVGRPDKAKLTYEEILEKGESIPSWESDLINASSIAFTATYDDNTLLILGDANPEIVFQELLKLGYSPENKLNLSLCKISHHGSKTSTSKNLLSIIECDLYYISTDGSGPNYHPDRETIVRIAEYARPNVSHSIKIYTNYKLDLPHIINEEECKKWNITIEHRENVNLNNTHAL